LITLCLNILADLVSLRSNSISFHNLGNIADGKLSKFLFKTRLNLYDFVLFHSAKDLNIYAQVKFVDKPQLKILSVLNYKHYYLIITWPKKACKGTAVNWVLPSFHGGSEINKNIKHTNNNHNKGKTVSQKQISFNIKISL